MIVIVTDSDILNDSDSQIVIVKVNLKVVW